MSLVRLLAIGKSLISIRDKPNHYRMLRGGWPPKFGGQKNPFAQAPPVVPEPCGSEQRAAADSARPVRIQAPSGVQAVGVVGSTSGGASARAKPARKLLGALNPFSRRIDLGRRSSGKGASGSVVQCELSLENVKVVRNDLSDADVEIVPVRPETASTLAKVSGGAVSNTSIAAHLLSEAAASQSGGKLAKVKCAP